MVLLQKYECACLQGAAPAPAEVLWNGWSTPPAPQFQIRDCDLYDKDDDKTKPLLPICLTLHNTIVAWPWAKAVGRSSPKF